MKKGKAGWQRTPCLGQDKQESGCRSGKPDFAGEAHLEKSRWDGTNEKITHRLSG